MHVNHITLCLVTWTQNKYGTKDITYENFGWLIQRTDNTSKAYKLREVSIQWMVLDLMCNEISLICTIIQKCWCMNYKV